MKKNIFKNIILIILVILLILDILIRLDIIKIDNTNKDTSSEEKKEYSSSFKEDYEKLNGSSITVNIPEDNPFEEVEAKDIIEKINNKETFYVYFGFDSCPWCRNAIELAIESAKEHNIDRIYYVDIKEIRDVYKYENGELTKKNDGTPEYLELLSLLDNVLYKYSILKDDGDTEQLEEKRIMAPNYIYVRNGVPVKLISGTSSLQKNYDDEMTDEIKNDIKKQFDELFSLND